MLVGLVAANPVYADQIGVEKEAPVLYTGETVEVRGIWIEDPVCGRLLTSTSQHD